MNKEKWLAEVSWAGEETFIGTDFEGHAVVYDAEEKAPKGIGPMRALLTSLGACSAMDVAAILKKRKQKLTGLKILLSGERPEYGYPKPWQSIEMKYVISGEGLVREYVDEAVKDSFDKYCSVGATLKPGVKISYSVEISD